MAEGTAASSAAVTRKSGAIVNEGTGGAGIRSRLFAYLIDSIVLAAFTLVSFIIAGTSLFLATDGGKGHISDRAEWTFVGILMASVPVWLVLNLGLGVRRGQTVGQFVVGLQVAKEDGERPGPLRLLLYWLALHPLFFHPVLAVSWALFAYLAVVLAGSTVLFIAAVAVVILCFVAPIITLLSLLPDRNRRALHDRIAGVTVVRLE